MLILVKAVNKTGWWLILLLLSDMALIFGLFCPEFTLTLMIAHYRRECAVGTATPILCNF